MNSAVAMGALALCLCSTAPGAAELEAETRHYCEATGGTVKDTAQPAQFVCCYVRNRRCIEVDVDGRFSRVVDDALYLPPRSGAGQRPYSP